MIVTSGGIGGNHDMVRANWPNRMGRVPERMLTGVPAHVDGRMIAITEKTGARVINRDRMWHYTEGITNYDPIWPMHGIRIIPGPSSLWLDATGKRLPVPLYPGFDTLGTLEYIAKSGYDYTWFVLNAKIIGKEFGLSGQEQNPDLTGRSVRQLLASRAGSGAPGPVQAFVDQRRRLRQRKLIARVGVGDERPARCGCRWIMRRSPTRSPPATARWRTTSPRTARSPRSALPAGIWATGWAGWSLRTAWLDPKAGPLIAVKLHILTRKTLGGLETDLDSRVLKADGTPLDGLYAAGEVAGFGGGGVHGYRALEGTFLGGCIFSGRAAGRGAASDIAYRPSSAKPPTRRRRFRVALEGDRALFGQHLEVGAGHLAEPPVVDAAGLRGDDGLVDGHRPGRRHRPQVVDRLGDLHPRRRRRSGQDVDRLVRDEQRIAGMHEACGVLAVADEVRDVVYHRDFRVDDGMPATERADGQLADRQLVADVHRAGTARRAARWSAGRRRARRPDCRRAARAVAPDPRGRGVDG